jgi:hypothetical protein
MLDQQEFQRVADGADNIDAVAVVVDAARLLEGWLLSQCDR